MLSEKRIKILVVEDEVDRRELHCMHLSSANYWAHESNRLQEFDPIRDTDYQTINSVAEQLKHHFFHAALIDLSLSINGDRDSFGLDVLSALKNRREGTNGIIITAYGTTRLEREAWKVRGAYDWLDKSDYTKERLLDIVDDAVKNAKLRIDASMHSNLTFNNLIGSPTLNEIQAHLNGGSGEVIRSIVEEALRPWYPYDSSHRIASFETLHINKATHSILLVKLWSRYLGGCVELRLGSREVCSFLTEVNKRASKKEGEDFKEFVLDPNDKLAAVIEYNPSIKLEDLDNSLIPNE